MLSIKMKLPSISKSTFQCYYTQIIIPYQYKIKSLHLANPFINEIHFSSNSIELKFIQLETLILDKITYEYLGKLLNHLISFPYLSSLVIICVDFVPNQHIFYCQIFRLPILKYCNLSWRRIDRSNLLSFACNELSPIEYLIIKNACHLNELKALLLYVPQLRRLSISCVAKLTDSKIESCSTISNCLTNVSLDFERINSINFEIFESIIKNIFQQLQVLHISIKYNSTYLDSNRWKRLILSYMPHLRIFDFLFYTSSYSNNDIKEYVAQIDKFNSPFWFEREWVFKYHIDNKEYR
ncbi:unnamed protein product [Rotaria sordida]|uniref:Uncharacterized protein n=1 Tax=Rotaria sordida TaxID=392033 RepID=A0A819K4X8_9BILA|nr:unnamed protein product [Rotaria sordida]CAF3939997.1 unnamed protein product [Rotaria sordida]